MEKHSGFSFERFRALPERSLKTLYRNRTVDLPFNPKSLAAFLDRSSAPGDGSFLLRTIPYHHRSVDVGFLQAPIRENSAGHKNVYLQVDIKGGGFMSPETFESRKDSVFEGAIASHEDVFFAEHYQDHPWGYALLGLLDARMVDRIVENNRNLIDKGLRTEGIAGVYATSHIYRKGERVTVNQLKDEVVSEIHAKIAAERDPERRARLTSIVQDIRECFEPAIMIRLMRSVFRIRDFKDAPSEMAQKMLQEACDNLNVEAKELGKEADFDATSNEGKADWLAFMSSTLGKNLGVIHAAGMVHGYLHMGNVTLAGEIVDLDSVEKVDDNKDSNGKPVLAEGLSSFSSVDTRYHIPKWLLKDYRDMCFSFRSLAGEMQKKFRLTFDAQSLSEQFVEAYVETFARSKAFDALGVGETECVAALKNIAKTVIARGESISPIQRDK